MDLPLNIQKIAAQHLPTPVLQKLKYLLLFFDEEIAEYQRTPLTGNRIIDMEVLLNLFLQLCCPRCFEEGILLSEDSTYGLCSNFVIRCNYCDFYSRFSSSKTTLNCPEVNTRFVYGMRQIGKGFSAGFKLCGTLNLPRLSKTAYTNHENKLMSVISEVSELSMQKAASELLVLHPTKNKIVQCGISVDETWQRRGYSSINGCVAALSVDTGKVVDIEIMSSYCPTCRKISKMPRSIESETFAADHVCHSNFQGSVLKMKAVGATRIFQRSIVKRGLKYAHYYGDGDSKGFISVKDTYGKDSVTKYECIGHVQKRVGARLRKLKSKNKNLSGKGKLTDSFIDRLQTIMGLLFVAMLETYPVFSKMLLWLCFIAHQVSRNRCMGSVPSEKIIGATTSEHCLVAKSQTKNIKAYQMKY
ncbi:uncharacterized protein TNCV_2835461 [Trichonephila clavipes]|uniref:Mutator-like transposase domain-containing protein n=1 Tax=Trichonephila clavipes TaxID=2585209 RepID=A0A8X6VAB1_TRICX|nr:uncharacterized protein TNCV_2835461 [Trichonephila clavipes]